MNDIPSRPQTMGSGQSTGAVTPTQEVVAKRNANRSHTRVDALGRRITAKWLTPLERMKLAKLLGKDSGNEVYLGFATLACSVTHIDDEDVSFGTVRELDVLVDTLGEEGFECIGEIMSIDFKDKTGGLDLDKAKN